MISIARAALVALAFAAAGCGGPKTGPSEVGSTQPPKPAASAASSTVGAIHAHDITIGAADAKVTVIEYASPTCPGCAAFHEQLFPEFKQRFIETGQVRFVFR
ncbi:MAG: DsbA family protein, partial [Parvularculaceae bacterium]|nr:DsbA family protein [Parvularculaceae bacterium]